MAHQKAVWQPVLVIGGMASSPARRTAVPPGCHPTPAPRACLGHLHPSRCMDCSAPQMPLFTSPSRASCRSRGQCNPQAACPQSGDQTVQQPLVCASSITCFMACSPVPQKGSPPISAPRHFLQGCRPHAKLTCLVCCHRAELVWGLTQS